MLIKMLFLFALFAIQKRYGTLWDVTNKDCLSATFRFQQCLP